MLAACCCWGLENNCTRRLSEKSAAQIVILKGIFSGLGSMIVAWIGGEQFPQAKYAALVMLLGFVAYGLSIYFYVRAQKDLGAARTSACYAVNPFVPGRAQAEVSGAGGNGRAPERAALRPQKRICEFSDKRIRRKCGFFLWPDKENGILTNKTFILLLNFWQESGIVFRILNLPRGRTPFREEKKGST